MFDILIAYRTGNSFGSHRTEDNLDLPVESLDIAKENLQRIKKHHEIHDKLRNLSRYNPRDEKIEIPDFYVEETDGIIFKIDEQRTHQMDYPFWIGHFERIENAEIVVAALNNDDVLSISF